MDYQKEKIKSLQKRMNELLKQGDEKSKKELETVQTEMLEANGKMMSMSMKLMWFTMPVFLVAFAGMSYLFGGQTLESFVALPTFNGFNILNPFSWVPTGLSVQTGFFKMYFFYYLVSSLVMNGIEKVYDMKIKNNESSKKM